MKLLLDENLPKRSKEDYKVHEIYTVQDMGRAGIKNGKLLQLMMDEGFHALFTFDKDLQHQQNFIKYSLTVFVLSAHINSYQVLTLLTPQVLQVLNSGHLTPGPIVIR